jgi:hypothetical protein
LGIIFFASGLVMASKSANPASRADHGKMAWFWSILFASLLLAFPTTLAGLSTTMFGTDAMNADNPFSYMGTVQGEGKLKGLLPILQLFGLIAVVRGLVVLRTVGMYGNYSKGNASFSKGLVLIIAGILLVNLKKTLGLASGITGMNIGAGLF